MTSDDRAVSPKKDMPAALKPRRGKRIHAIIGLIVLLGAIISLATGIGSVDIPFMTTSKILLSRLPLIDIAPSWSGTIETIIADIRLPRVVLAGIVGSALSVAGATYQGLFRNPLAAPYLLGASQGAALGAVIGFMLPISWHGYGYGIIPALSFAGAFSAVSFVLAMSRMGGMMAVTRLILAGVALGAMLQAVISYLINISGERIHGIVFWLMGSFSLSKWSEVTFSLPAVIAGVIVIVINARALNLIQLGEEQAQQLGINVEKVKIMLLGAATLITAASVSFVGVIGFVGIIIPHMVRLIWGPDYRFLLPLSILVGAIFLIVCDIGARTIAAPAEIPVGVFTAACGAPFFLYLLKRRTKFLF